MSLFRQEVPALSPNAFVDEGVGIDQGSKVIGSWNETFLVPAATQAVSQSVYIAPYAVELVGFQTVYGTASTSGTVTVEKLTGTTAPASGTALLTGAVTTSTTANTVKSGTLITTPASLQLAAGDRLGLVFAGTQTNLVGEVVSLRLKRI